MRYGEINLFFQPDSQACLEGQPGDTGHQAKAMTCSGELVPNATPWNVDMARVVNRCDGGTLCRMVLMADVYLARVSRKKHFVKKQLDGEVV